MLRRIAFTLAALTLAFAAPAAFADGDPASDVLPSQDAFFPYSPQASKPLVLALDKVLKEVRGKGFPVKVAMIGSEADLGSYPTMFNNPQEYANLLASELPSNPHGGVKDEIRLLVVMPGGFGGKNLGDRVDAALAPVKIDTQAGTDGLVRAALQAVPRIATLAGHQTATPPEAQAGGGKGAGGTSVVVWVLAGVLALALIMGVLVVLARRRSDARPPEVGEAQGAEPGDRSP